MKVFTLDLSNNLRDPIIKKGELIKQLHTNNLTSFDVLKPIGLIENLTELSLNFSNNGFKGANFKLC